MRSGHAIRLLILALVIPCLLVPNFVAVADVSDVNESCRLDNASTGNMFFYNGPVTCHGLIKSLTVQPTDGGANVSWIPKVQTITESCGMYNESADCPVLGYRVVVSFDPATRTGGGSCTAASSSQPSCSLTGLRNGVRYKIFLDTRISSGVYFRYSQPEAEAFTPCCSVALAPTSVTASFIGNAADIQWLAPSDWGGADALSYRVVSTPGGQSCETPSLTCRIQGLSFGQDYSFSVSAGNSAGNSSPAQSPQYPLPKSVPDSPAGGSVKYQRGDASVAWEAPPNDGGWRVSSYRVTSNPDRRTCVTTGSLSCVVRGLVGGRNYSFTVQASNAAGSSLPSPPIVAGRLVTPASTPRSVQASLAGNSAIVQWLPPRSMGGGAVRYVVRSTPQSRTCVTLANSCKINGLQPGSAYKFSVYAVNNSGQGPSAESTQISIPAPIAIKPEQPIS